MKIHITITDEKGNRYQGSSDLAKVKSNEKASQIEIKQKKKPKAPHVVLKLYEENFFKTAKTQQEVLIKMRSVGYNFDGEAVRMTLNRANYLKKEGNSKRNKYIQKFPPTEHLSN